MEISDCTAIFIKVFLLSNSLLSAMHFHLDTWISWGKAGKLKLTWHVTRSHMLLVLHVDNNGYKSEQRGHYSPFSGTF